MANRAKIHNIKNHKRQMAYLETGVVMLPTLKQESLIVRFGKKIKK